MPAANQLLTTNWTKLLDLNGYENTVAQFSLVSTAPFNFAINKYFHERFNVIGSNYATARCHWWRLLLRFAALNMQLDLLLLDNCRKSNFTATELLQSDVFYHAEIEINRMRKNQTWSVVKTYNPRDCTVIANEWLLIQ